MSYKELADLEAKRQDSKQLSDETRNKIAGLLGVLDVQEKQEQEDRKRAKELAKEQTAKDLRNESVEQGESVRADVARLESKYRKLG